MRQWLRRHSLGRNRLCICTYNYLNVQEWSSNDIIAVVYFVRHDISLTPPIPNAADDGETLNFCLTRFLTWGFSLAHTDEISHISRKSVHDVASEWGKLQKVI